MFSYDAKRWCKDDKKDGGAVSMNLDGGYGSDFLITKCQIGRLMELVITLRLWKG